MADFNTTQMGEPSGSPFQPIQPVVQPSPIAEVVEGIGKIMPVVSNIQRQKAQEQQQVSLGGFTNRALKYAQAVEQGAMSSRDARTSLRSEFKRAVADNPGMYDELYKRYSNVVNQAGLGKIIDEGTVAEQEQEKLEREVMSLGLVGTDAQEEDVWEATVEYAAYKRAEQDLRSLKSRLDFEAKTVGLESSKLSLIQAREKDMSQKALFSLSSNYTPLFRRKLNTVIDELQNGAVSPEDAVLQLQRDWEQVQHQISSVGHQAGSDYISNLAQPMRMMYENTLAYVNGETSLDVLNTQNEKAIALSSKNWLSDPMLAETVAGSRLLPNSDLLKVFGRLENQVVEHFRRNSIEGGTPADPLPNTPEERRSFEVNVDILKENMRRDVRQGLDPEAETELLQHVNAMFDGINLYSHSRKDPAAYRPVMGFLGSSEFGNWTSARGGIPSDIADEVSFVLSQTYERELIPAIQSAYESPAVGAGARQAPGTMGFPVTGRAPQPIRPLAEVVKPHFSGSGIVFRAEGNNRDLRGVSSRVTDLNRTLAPLINEAIRAYAHIEGHKNYRRVYEDRYSHVFGEQIPEAQVQETREQPQQDVRPAAWPNVGQVVDGYEYLGGNPNEPDSWRRQGG